MMRRPFEKILLYVEASGTAIDAARCAVALAKAHGGQVHAVYVVDERQLHDLLRARVFLADEQVDLERDLEYDGRKYLALVEKMGEDKGVRIATELRRGNVHREVLDKAEQIGATLIIIGEIEEIVSRRDSFYDEGEMVLRYAKCPVLVARGTGIINEIYDSI